MPNYTNPFWIVGTGMQLILLIWVLYLFVKLHKYFKGARKLSFEPEVAAWAKVVMDPLAPRRPQKSLVTRVAKGIADAEGNKRRSPWIQRGLAVGVLVIVAVLLFNIGFFAPLFGDRAATTVSFTAKILSTVHFYGTAACGDATVTQVLMMVEGQNVLISFEGDHVFNSTWYEFTIQQSPRCRPGYYELVSLKEVTVANVAPAQA